jgi:hypothetical protein
MKFFLNFRNKIRYYTHSGPEEDCNSTFSKFMLKSYFFRYERIRPHGAYRGACRFRTETLIYPRVFSPIIRQNLILQV